MTTTPDTPPEQYDFTRSDGDLPPATAKSTIPDPDLAPVTEKSDLELIREDLKATLNDASIVLPVETRPGYSLQFDTEIKYEQFEKWRNASKDRKASGGLNVTRLAALVIANKCTAILKNGKALVDDDGDNLTFGSDEIRTMLNTARAADAVAALIGRDSLITAISDAVVNASGWGAEVNEVDPSAAD